MFGCGKWVEENKEQYKGYTKMPYKQTHGIKVVNDTTYNAMTSAIPKCISLINNYND